MDLLHSIILGIIQGITEFLPISSTAHLTLTPWVLSWPDPGLVHNVALHFGSLIAIIYYFRKEWILISKDIFHVLRYGNPCNAKYGMKGIYICLATIPGSISGFLFESQAATVLREPLVIALSLTVFSIILIWGDLRSKRNRSISELTLKDCMVIGVAQAFAIIPGASRSGVCITGALFRDLNRQDAARFSFMLGAPLILGASIYESRNIDPASLIDLTFVSGVAASAIFALLSIKYLIKFVSTSHYRYFAYYRIALAVVIVMVELIFH